MVACIVNLASQHQGDKYKVTSYNQDYSIPDSKQSRVQVQLQAASITRRSEDLNCDNKFNGEPQKVAMMAPVVSTHKDILLARKKLWKS